MDGHRTKAFRLEEGRHEISMPCRDAEPERSRCGSFAELLKRVLGSSLSCHCGCQRLFVEACAAPGDVGVVDLIWHTEVPKRRKQFLANAVHQIASVHQILLAECEKVSAISPLRRRRQA